MILARILPFPGTLPDSIIFRYSHIFDLFPVLVGTVFRYSHGLYLFWYSLEHFFDTQKDLPLPGNLPDSTIFRYSHRFDTFPILVGTVFRYSQGFYLFPVLARILPFFVTCRDSFSILVRILHFFGTRPHSYIFRYSYIFEPLSGVAGTVFRYSHELYLFWYSLEHFFDTHRDLPLPGNLPDSTIFRYSHRFDPFLVLARTVFRYSHGLYLFWYSPEHFFDTRRDSSFAR